MISAVGCPAILSENYYPAILAAMTQPNPSLESGACELPCDTNDYRTRWDIYLPDQRFDTSFTRQIHEVEQGEVDVLGSTPDVYLVTMRSAVPVADAIRGYYASLGKECPPIHGLRANKTDADNYSFGLVLGSIAFAEAVEEIQPVVEGAHHVCVVEQYVHSGSVLCYANQILEAAGVINATAIRGRWYEDASIEDADLNELSVSEHREFMLGVGKQAALVARELPAGFSGRIKRQVKRSLQLQEQ